MEVSDAISLTTAFFGMLGLIFSGIKFRELKKQESLNYKQRTLEYVSTQFDRLAEIKAREEMANTGEMEILEYVNSLSQDVKIKEQRLLEYVYVFNRIGAGMYNGSLDKDVIFNLWAPSFFMKHWNKYKSFIIEKRKYNENAYVFFDWLATQECPKYLNTYPQERAKHHS